MKKFFNNKKIQRESIAIPKGFIFFALLMFFSVGCVTTFKASKYTETVTPKIETKTHFVKTIKSPDFTSIAAVTKQNNFAPNETMAPAIDASLKSILQTNSPFKNFSVAADEKVEVNDNELYIIVFLDQLKAYLYGNKSWYNIDSKIVMANGKGDIFMANEYKISAPSSAGTLQSAQNKAVQALMKKFYADIDTTDFKSPVHSDLKESIKIIIGSNP